MESGLVRKTLLELNRTGEAQRRVTVAGIIEVSDVTSQQDGGFGMRLKRGAPNQLNFSASRKTF